MIRAQVITCSDGASRGTREDHSGPAVRDMLIANGYDAGEVVVVPDDTSAIGDAIVAAVAAGARLVVTTGGTGIAARDVTPEATLAVCGKPVPGFGEVMRADSLRRTPMAALSRAGAAVRETALVVNVPGSIRGATENLSAVLDLIPHALEILEGNTEHDGPAGT